MIYDDEVKGKLYEWGVRCVEDIKFFPINMWTQFLKPNLKVIDISWAEFALKQFQEEKLNIRANAPLPINNPIGTKKPPNPRNRNTFKGVNVGNNFVD